MERNPLYLNHINKKEQGSNEYLLINEYTDPSAFDALAPSWDHLTNLSTPPFLTRQWQKVWWHYRNQRRRLKILVVREENGEVCGIAPLSVEEKNGEQILTFLGSRDLCDYLDFIVLQGKEGHFYHLLLSYLTSSALPTTLHLQSIHHQSPTLTYLKEYASKQNCSIHVSLEDTAPSLMLPDSFETYLKSLTPKHRHEIRRKVRRAEKDTRLSFKKVNSHPQVMETMHQFLQMFRNSGEYKRAFLTQEKESFFLAIAEECSQYGWLEFFILSLGTKNIAFLLCFNARNTLYLYNSVYDPAYASLSPGIVALAYCLEDAINRGIFRFDFMRGNELYKYYFGAEDHKLYTLTLRFGKTL